MKLVLICAGGLAALILLGLWLISQIHYRIGSKHLKITLLGLTVRKIDLADIRRVSKRTPSKAAERWHNTLKPGHRILTIQRHSGLRKAVVITPRNRYIFLAELRRAIQRAQPAADLDEMVDSSGDQETASTP